MSQSYPPHLSAQPNPYAGHPAYAPGPPSRGMNPWLAAALGALGGAALTALAGALLWVAMGGPLPWQGIDDAAAAWSGRVEVAPDGSVAGADLADAVLEVGGGGFYQDVTCAETETVAEDVTTVCRVDDSHDRYRVVVLFLDDDGRFETAELYSQ